MAVIPQIVTSPGAVPGTPSAPSGGGLVRASPQMDVRAPSDPSQAQAAGAQMEAQALESTSRSAEKVAQYGEQFAETYVKAKLNIDAANRTADLSAQLHQAEFESSKIADRDAAAADFDGRAAKIRDDFAAQDVNPRVRAAVDASLPNQIALRRASTQNAAFGLWAKAQVGSLVTNLDQYNKQAVDAQDPRLTQQLIAQANAAIDGRVEGGALGADVAAKMKVDFKSNVTRTKQEMAFATDMRAGIALYNATKGDLNAADGLAMGRMAVDRSKQLEAETEVSRNMPVRGQYGNVTHWGGQIESAAAATGVPAPLIAAVASAESGGDPNARSPAGASGPMQFIPGTAAQVGLKPGEEKDPAKAIPKGAEYLKEQMATFGKERGIMAYNWGPGNVQRWIAAGADPSKVPAETKAYLAEVLRKEALFGGTAAGNPDSWKVASYQYLDNLEKSDMDPEKKARMRAIAHQRLGAQQGVEAAQTAQIKDQEEQAGVAWSNGKLKPGTWQQIADGYGRVGDFGKRDAYQGMADQESLYLQFGSATPEEQRRMAPFLPGVAGQIARAVIAEGTADRAVIRGEAQRTEEEARKLIAEPSADARAAIKVSEDAITGYLRAGTSADIAKATALREVLGGMIEGKITGGMPAAEAQAAMARIQEKMQNGGFTRAEAAQIGILRKQMEHTENLRNKDPIQLGSEALGPMTPSPLQGSPEEQAKAMQARNERAAWIDGKYFPGAGQRITPVLTAQEIAQEVQVLKTGSVENRQTEARRLAAILPRDQITILAKHIGGDGADGLSSAIAEAIPLYASGDQQNIEIANSIIRGANRLYESGEAGKVKTDPTLTQTLTNALAPARISGKWDGRDIKRQDHAIMSRYVDLMGAKDLNFPDPEKLNQAMKDVVGTPYASWSHGNVLLPKGVDSSTFNDAISSIRGNEIPPLQPARDGRPITDQKIRSEGVFATVGNGVYQVRMKDPGDGIERDLIRHNGLPWIIDMKPLFTRVQGGQPTFTPGMSTPDIQ